MSSVQALLELAVEKHKHVVSQFESELAFARNENVSLQAALRRSGEDGSDPHGVDSFNEVRLATEQSHTARSGLMAPYLLHGLCPCFGATHWPLPAPKRRDARHPSEWLSQSLRTVGSADFTSTPLPPCGEEKSGAAAGETMEAELPQRSSNSGRRSIGAMVDIPETQTEDITASGSTFRKSASDDQMKAEHSYRTKTLCKKFEEEGEDHDNDMQWMGLASSDSRCFLWLAKIAVSMPFEIFCSTVVILNMISLTLYYNSVEGVPEDTVSLFDAAELVFASWYLLELIIRVVPFGLGVFCGHDKKWYWFDAGMVLASLLGAVYPHGSGNADPLRVSKIVKLARLLRASRMLKLARVMKQSVQFSLLFNLLGEALGCFFWAIFTMAATTYTFSLLLLSQVSDSLRLISPGAQDILLKHFGSLGRSMLTCFMAVAGGLEWSSLVVSLSEVGPAALFTFVTYTLLVHFLIYNLALALFLQTTLRTIYNNDRETLSGHMQRRHQYVEKLKDVFQCDWVSWPQFHAEESNPRVRALLALLRIERSQARKLFQVLSANGQHSVDLHSWVVGCINMKRAVNPMDLMEMEMMNHGFLEENKQLVMACLKRSSTLESFSNKQVSIPDLVHTVSPDVFARHLFHAARQGAMNVAFHGGHSPKTQKDEFLRTVQRVAELSLRAEGGCGFVVAPGEAFRWLQEMHAVDFQVVDRSKEYPRGYMTSRLKGISVHDQEFLDAVCELSEHSPDDRWPEGHEAVGLPKDGYILVDVEGLRVLCTARMIGLPVPPVAWDGVGTRHMAAVAAAHALRQWACAVIVRSDSGKIHGICSAPKRNVGISIVACHVE